MSMRGGGEAAWNMRGAAKGGTPPSGPAAHARRLPLVGSAYALSLRLRGEPRLGAHAPWGSA